jgi:hypothetical protein
MEGPAGGRCRMGMAIAAAVCLMPLLQLWGCVAVEANAGDNQL